MFKDVTEELARLELKTVAELRKLAIAKRKAGALGATGLEIQGASKATLITWLVSGKNEVEAIQGATDAPPEVGGVKAAVLKRIIDRYPTLRNHEIETAHPEHPMSGTRILRRLGAAGVVDYEYNRYNGTYTVLTPVADLKRSFERMVQA